MAQRGFFEGPGERDQLVNPRRYVHPNQNEKPLLKRGSNRITWSPSKDSGNHRLLARKLANGDALAVLLNVTEVAKANALSNVSARCEGELEGILDVVAVVIPLVQEGSERGIASANGGNELDVELTLSIPDVLAVGEVGGTTATHGEQDVLDTDLMSHGEGATGIIISIDLDPEDLAHLMMVGLDEQRFLSCKVLQLRAREVEYNIGAAGLGMVDDLIQKILGSAGRNGTGNDQTIEVAGGVQDLVELLLVLRGDRSTGVKDAVLVLAIIDVCADTGDAVNPNGAAKAAHVHGLLDDELTGKAGKEAKSDGIDAELLEGVGNIQALTVGRVASGARTDVLVRNKTVAGNSHIDCWISRECIEHIAPFIQ
jgi:hypothetical protein